MADRLEVVERARGEDGTEKVILAASSGRDEYHALHSHDSGAADGAAPLRGRPLRRCAARSKRCGFRVATAAPCASRRRSAALDCTFCATGTLRFRGNLEPWQIVDQVYALERLRASAPRTWCSWEWGSRSTTTNGRCERRTCSTIPRGRTSGRATSRSRPRASPPESSASPPRRNPGTSPSRSTIPIPRGAPSSCRSRCATRSDELLEAARRYTVERRRRITFEYVMMPGVNMGRREVEQLSSIGRSMRCKINLIPLNTAILPARRPSRQAQRKRTRSTTRCSRRAYRCSTGDRPVARSRALVACSRCAA